jgi:hypothetical protein
MAGREIKARWDIQGMQRNDGKFKLKHGDNRHCEEHLRRSNPFFLGVAQWIASLRSQ